MKQELYSDKQAAAFLGCGVSTLWRWSAEGTIAKPIRIGGMTRWKLADLQAAIDLADQNRHRENK